LKDVVTRQFQFSWRPIPFLNAIREYDID